MFLQRNENTTQTNHIQGKTVIIHISDSVQQYSNNKIEMMTINYQTPTYMC